VEHVRELDFGDPGKLADLASRIPRADDEQALARQVDLPLQVSQQGRLGYRIGNEVGRQPVRVHPVEHQDRRTERLRVSRLTLPVQPGVHQDRGDARTDQRAD
jgi:hypothetical protein